MNQPPRKRPAAPHDDLSSDAAWAPVEARVLFEAARVHDPTEPGQWVHRSMKSGWRRPRLGRPLTLGILGLGGLAFGAVATLAPIREASNAVLVPAHAGAVVEGAEKTILQSRPKPKPADHLGRWETVAPSPALPRAEAEARARGGDRARGPLRGGSDAVVAPLRGGSDGAGGSDAGTALVRRDSDVVNDSAPPPSGEGGGSKTEARESRERTEAEPESGPSIQPRVELSPTEAPNPPPGKRDLHEDYEPRHQQELDERKINATGDI